MDLKLQTKRTPPFPLAIITIVSGAFFLLGVGVSVFTLNTVEASQSGRAELNIAKLTETKTIESNLMTDVMTITAADFEGKLSFEYPSKWEEVELEEGEESDWDYQFNLNEEAMRFVVTRSGEDTHIQTATKFAQMIGEVEGTVELIDGGETSSEKLVFGIYSFKVGGSVERIAVVDITDSTTDGSGEIRLIIQTNTNTQTLKTLVNRVNLSK